MMLTAFAAPPPPSTKDFDSLCREAAAIVAQHWPEIAAA
jgi:hypothetical protein